MFLRLINVYSIDWTDSLDGLFSQIEKINVAENLKSIIQVVN